MATGLAFNWLTNSRQASTLTFGIALIFLAQTLRHQSPNADANEPIGQQIALQQVIEPFGRR